MLRRSRKKSFAKFFCHQCGLLGHWHEECGTREHDIGKWSGVILFWWTDVEEEFGVVALAVVPWEAELPTWGGREQEQGSVRMGLIME